MRISFLNSSYLSMNLVGDLFEVKSKYVDFSGALLAKIKTTEERTKRKITEE